MFNGSEGKMSQKEMSLNKRRKGKMRIGETGAEQPSKLARADFSLQD